MQLASPKAGAGGGFPDTCYVCKVSSWQSHSSEAMNTHIRTSPPLGSTMWASEVQKGVCTLRPPSEGARGGLPSPPLCALPKRPNLPESFLSGASRGGGVSFCRMYSRPTSPAMRLEEPPSPVNAAFITSRMPSICFLRAQPSVRLVSAAMVDLLIIERRGQAICSRRRGSGLGSEGLVRGGALILHYHCIIRFLRSLGQPPPPLPFPPTDSLRLQCAAMNHPQKRDEQFS